MAVPVLLGTTFIIFAAVFALPGDPIQALAGANQVIPPATAAALRAYYHLNDPLIVQYLRYLADVAHGDLGTSFSGESVSSIIGGAWPVTFQLAITAWIIEAVAGITLGTLAGMRRGRAPDVAVLAGTTLIMGVPFFLAGYLVQFVFGIRLHWLPVSGIDDGWPVAYLLPGVVLALYGLPQVVRLTRTSVLENLGAPHVDSAIAKGLPGRRVLWLHVVRNSLIPVVSLLGASLGYLLGGTVLVEGIFNLPGLGYQVYTAIGNHDGPVVVGIGTLLVLVFLILNLAVDLLYGVLDPRIRVD